MKNPFRFQGSIKAPPYLVASLAIVATEYIALDLIYASGDHPALGAGNLAYWFPVSMFGLGRIFQPGGTLSYWRLLAILACVAAAWVLLALAIRRARTVNCSSLVASLVIVPIIQVPTILWLGFSTLEDYTPVAGNRVPIDVALKGLIAGLLLTLALVAASTLVFHAYGFGLFVASPFFVGCVTAYIGNRQADIGARATIRLVLGACFMGGVGLLAVAIEGIICLVLASPIIAIMAGVGGLIGRAIALKGPGAGRAAMSFVVLPLSFVVDLALPPNYSFESAESIEVAASSQQVWDAVVHMGPIPAPPPAPFRWGLAYPMSGTITGSGVGAIREGVFSTGVAYERVTEWQPGSKLSFIVLSDPPTMRELSPYKTVHAPHVNGYFRTRDARFTITPLANGHTRLSLATQHELDLSPAFYWSPMAKWAVHTNKVRVLAHFAQQAEFAARADNGASAGASME